jgi:hypothetical protein
MAPGRFCFFVRLHDINHKTGALEKIILPGRAIQEKSRYFREV